MSENIKSMSTNLRNDDQDFFGENYKISLWDDRDTYTEGNTCHVY